MNFTFLVWLLALVLCAALLGITMYSLISLSDLENDFVNPHDSSVSINRWVVRSACRYVFLRFIFVYRRAQATSCFATCKVACAAAL